MSGVNHPTLRAHRLHRAGQRTVLSASMSVLITPVFSFYFTHFYSVGRLTFYCKKKEGKYTKTNVCLLETPQLFKLKKLLTRRKEPFTMDFNWLLVHLLGGGNHLAFGFRPCWEPRTSIDSSLMHALSLLYFPINIACFRDSGTWL